MNLQRKITIPILENLCVNKIISTNVVIPESTHRKHLFVGNTCNFTEFEAIKMSLRRGNQFLINSKGLNTVFQHPGNFLHCETNDFNNQMMVISQSKVKTFLCCYDYDLKQWNAVFLGEFHVLFCSYNRTADHFVGYLYKNIQFPTNIA